MRTLYVSDLDGTLLHSDQTLSSYTCDVICRLAAQGGLFSYATARSFVTAAKVTRGLPAQLPLIVYNGTFIVDSTTGERLLTNAFPPEADAVLRDLLSHDVFPIVYSFRDGKECFCYAEDEAARFPGLKMFLDSRAGDPRATPVQGAEALFAGEKFYYTCIDHPEKLRPLYEKYKNEYRCLFQKDVYTDTTWLEIMPSAASKSNAALQLKRLLGCDRLVVFGDGLNDADLFRVADECYAVENAVPQLKAMATGVIAGNNEDGVAKWLEKTMGGVG